MSTISIPESVTPAGLRARAEIMRGNHEISCARHLELAAAEIERLTAALAAQTAQQAYPCSPHCAGYLREQAAEAEIERLRAVLRSINNVAHGFDARIIARNALQQSTQPTEK